MGVAMMFTKTLQINLYVLYLCEIIAGHILHCCLHSDFNAMSVS